MVKTIRKLYDRRSKYVHQGISPGDEDIELTEKICHEILKCLLRLQKDEGQRERLQISDWLKKLDLISAILETGK
jgi:hypothetical protein